MKRLLDRRALTAAVVAGAASQGAAIGLIATATWLVVRAADRPPLSALAVAIAAVRAFALLRGVLRYAERLAGHDAALRSLADLRVRVYAALAGGPALRDRHTGELLTDAVSEVDAVTDLVVRSLLPAGSALLVSVGAVVGLGLASPGTAGLVAAGLLVGGLLVPAAASWQARRSMVRTQSARAELSVATIDLLQGAADLAVAGATPAARRTAEQAGDRLAARQRSTPAYGATALTLLVSGMSALAVLATTHSAVLTLTTLALFEVCAPLPAAARHWTQARAALRRVGDLLDTEPVARPAFPARGTLEVTGLRVEYDGWPALRAVDLRLEPGRRIAVVGASGSGKSTLLAALVGFVPRAAGSVRIGGVPVADCDLPATVGGVLADAHVFHASIGDNVRLADPSASDEEVNAALRRARLGDWVASLPSGLATVVGEDAALLSGGQRQRLLLARALLADPPILLLDEPSEGLDSATADAVLADLLAATAERTTVLVTHRLAGLDAVDEVVLVDGGVIVQRGPHRQLLDNPGPYRDLWLAQHRNLNAPAAVNPPDQAVSAKS